MLCGLGAAPPAMYVDLLVSEARKDPRTSSVRMHQLPPHLRRFFFEDGRQKTKAMKRLMDLATLLELLGLIGTSEASTADDCRRISKVKVVRYVSHRVWSPDPFLVAMLSGGNERQPGRNALRNFDMYMSDERNEYWETLKVICTRTYRCDVNDFKPPGEDHNFVDIDNSGAKSRPRDRDPSYEELPAQTRLVLAKLRERQWSARRPITATQKRRLLQAAPAVLPETQDELHRLADELEVKHQGPLHHMRIPTFAHAHPYSCPPQTSICNLSSLFSMFVTDALQPARRYTRCTLCTLHGTCRHMKAEKRRHHVLEVRWHTIPFTQRVLQTRPPPQHSSPL